MILKNLNEKNKENHQNFNAFIKKFEIKIFDNESRLEIETAKNSKFSQTIWPSGFSFRSQKCVVHDEIHFKS